MTDKSQTAVREDGICITCGKRGGSCQWIDDTEGCMRKQLEEMRAALPAGWLAAVVKLLNEMAGEVSMVGCDEPENLMTEIAEHLGVGDADDCWAAAVIKLAGVTDG
jgi:hypothetical protein